MKKIIAVMALVVICAGNARAVRPGSVGDPYYMYEVAYSTFNSGAFTASTHTATMITPVDSTYDYFSITVWNITTSSMAYTLCSSSYTVDTTFSCSTGGLIGAGTDTDPFILTEQFHSLYMWILACGEEDVSSRYAARGRK